MNFRYSTKIFKRINHSDEDSIKAIEPDVYVGETISDFIAKRDPVWDYTIGHLR
jgi:hypothetical protein